MPHRTFVLFVLPSALAMLLFIALPLVSVVWQSFFIEHAQVLVSVESCDPFGCTTDTRVDAAAMEALREAAPQGRWNGLRTYADAGHLALAEVRAIWAGAPDWGTALSRTLRLPFYGALLFTLAYTAVVSPLSLGLGLLIALAVNALPRMVRGVVIYFTLLPMIVPSVVGALTLRWMIDGRGVIGSLARWLSGDPELSLRASSGLTWAVLFAQGVWGSAPFVFIILYAALQTQPRDILESAMIDGASRTQRFAWVTWPHLAPVATFLILVLVMDNFRVFEAIIGLNAQAHASSLSTLIFAALRSGDAPLFGSAAATSVLTMMGIALLLLPPLRRSWREFATKA